MSFFDLIYFTFFMDRGVLLVFGVFLVVFAFGVFLVVFGVFLAVFLVVTFLVVFGVLFSVVFGVLAGLGVFLALVFLNAFGVFLAVGVFIARRERNVAVVDFLKWISNCEYDVSESTDKKLPQSEYLFIFRI